MINRIKELIIEEKDHLGIHNMLYKIRPIYFY